MSSAAAHLHSRLRDLDALGRLRRLHEALGTYAVVGLAIAVLVGGALRIAWADWDDGSHLHPDERYVSSVANDIGWPASPVEYFDVGSSPLSPYNTETGRSYVYGMLPLFGSKLVATVLGDDDYDHLYVVARRLSALLDTASVLLVALIAFRLLADRGRHLAAAGAATASLLYAFTVTAIQHAHFFTVDSWLVFFTLVTFVFALGALGATESTAARRVNLRFLLVGAAAGLTVACKTPGALVLVPVALALLADAVGSRGRIGRRLLRLLLGTLATAATAYVAFRTVSPYTFASSNWLDVSLNEQFRSTLQDEFRRVDGEFLIPPSYQWLLSTPVWSPLVNLVKWQLGWALGLTALLGIGVLAFDIVRSAVRARRPNTRASLPLGLVAGRLMLLAFVLTVFFWIAPRFAHMGRYLVPITPFLAVAAAFGLVVLLGRRPRVLGACAGVVIAATALYALAFEHVYTEPHTRVQATRWIDENVPEGSAIANEHWDDWLPVGGSAARVQQLELPVFEPDDDTKLGRLYEVLSRADYYALSSPRAWQTIGRLPDRYPLMSRFYAELFAGRLGFVEVASFANEPELLGIRLHDLAAEEAFWVYDHPPVKIYRRTGPLGWETFRTTLCPEPIAACSEAAG